VERISKAGTTLTKLTTNAVLSLPILSTLIGAILSSERQFLQEPHGITSQMMAFFIVTAVKT
jgi:hypothetical protein